MVMDFMNSPRFQQGKTRLARPLLPLVRLFQLLYLTAPVDRVADLLAQLTEPIETGGVLYDEPAALLAPYLPTLQELARIKEGRPLPWAVLDDRQEPLDSFEAAELWLSQQILIAELEEINSLLCAPCRCTLCCVGPDRDMAQLFFEIPLTGAETRLFELRRTETPESLGGSAMDEPPLAVDGRPFYEAAAGLIHWQRGWSLILPMATACPNLDENGGCRIYSVRPEVCRRPQIFPYVLTETAETAAGGGGQPVPAFTAARKILAVWDCPYVRALKDEIAAYAELCGLTPVFRTNKS